MCDFVLPVTLITVTGAVFGVTMVAYASKSRFENVIKIPFDDAATGVPVISKPALILNSSSIKYTSTLLWRVRT